MTHSQAVAIARGGEGAIVAELMRLSESTDRNSVLDDVRFVVNECLEPIDRGEILSYAAMQAALIEIRNVIR